MERFPLTPEPGMAFQTDTQMPVLTNAEKLQRMIMAEAEQLKKMCHPNIVEYGGVNKDMVLFKDMEGTPSLADLIMRKMDANDEPFTPKQILKIAKEISNALIYIHNELHMLYGNMRSLSILVHGDFEIIKLWDFRHLMPLNEQGVFDKSQHMNVRYTGSHRWRAVEVVKSGEITHKADIWSLGVTLWEMMALWWPHTWHESMGQLSPEYFAKLLGTRPEIPAHIKEDVYADPIALFLLCTETASKRPTAKELHKIASDMLDRCEN